MSHTHHLRLATALILGAFAATAGFSAQAQTTAITDSPAPVESGPALAQPLSLMQPYSPTGKADASLKLLIDEPAAETASVAAVSPVAAAPAQSDEIGQQPAINALGAGRFALTVSQRPAR